MNEISQAIETSQKINDVTVVGILFLAVVGLIFLLRDKKKIEELLLGLKISTEQMVELNKKYQTYYEKMIENLEKKEDKTLQIQEEILKEVKYNRDFYQKKLQERLK